jgi:hypothetical protein
MTEESKMKRKLVIEYDDVELFDAIANVGDGGVAVGTRIAQSLLAPAGFSTQLGLAFYGISISDATPTGESKC